MNDLRMPPVSPEELCRNIEEKLPAGARDWVVMRLVEDSGLSINVDGDECLTSIGIWPNGCCDVDFLFVSTERGEFRHFVFGSTEEAVTTVLKEIILAVERGGKTSLTAQKQTVKCEYQIQDESPMNRHLKLFGRGMVVFVASWWLAYFWSIHGSWWFAHRPESILTAIHTIAKPILSTEVWAAEEQLDFLSFWLPTLVSLILVISLCLFARKFFRTEDE